MRKYNGPEPRVEIGGENEVGNEIDDDALVEAEIGRMRNRGNMLDRRARNYVGDGGDRNMNNIKMTIPSFKERSDSEAYLE